MTRDYPLRRWLMRTIHNVEIPREIRPVRHSPPRDWKYRAWIRSLPCAACGSMQYVEAAHTGEDGGMSMKASDYTCIPLCAWCHRCGTESYHVLGKWAFARLHALDHRALSKRLYEAWKLLRMPGR